MQAGTKLSLTQELGNHVMNAGQPYQSPRQRVWTAIRKHRESSLSNKSLNLVR